MRAICFTWWKSYRRAQRCTNHTSSQHLNSTRWGSFHYISLAVEQQTDRYDPRTLVWLDCCWRRCSDVSRRWSTLWYTCYFHVPCSGCDDLALHTPYEAWECLGSPRRTTFLNLLQPRHDFSFVAEYGFIDGSVDAASNVIIIPRLWNIREITMWPSYYTSINPCPLSFPLPPWQES